MEVAVTFVFGLLHGLEPDHLVAISAIAARGTGARLRVGLEFGLGHVLVLGIGAALAVGMRVAIPPELEQGAEIASGATLVALGAWCLVARASTLVAHSHPHRHEGGGVHEHLHLHRLGAEHDHAHVGLVLGGLFAVGAVRSVVLVALPALHAGSTASAVAAVALFGLGIVLSMTGAGWLLDRLHGAVARRGSNPVAWARRATGLVALGVGVVWIVRSLA